MARTRARFLFLGELKIILLWYWSTFLLVCVNILAATLTEWTSLVSLFGKFFEAGCANASRSLSLDRGPSMGTIMKDQDRYSKLQQVTAS